RHPALLGDPAVGCLGPFRVRQDQLDGPPLVRRCAPQAVLVVAPGRVEQGIPRAALSDVGADLLLSGQPASGEAVEPVRHPKALAVVEQDDGGQFFSGGVSAGVFPDSVIAEAGAGLHAAVDTNAVDLYLAAHKPSVGCVRPMTDLPF